MTEAEWLTCSDPTPMLEFLRGKASDRRLRLFAVGSVRLVFRWLVHPNSRAAVEASERVAEGINSPDILATAYRAAWDVLPLEPYSDMHVTAARAAARTAQADAYEAATLTTNEVAELYAEWEEEKVTSEDEKYRVYWVGKTQGQAVLASCLRDIVCNPFRPLQPLPAAVLAWNDRNIRRLTEVIYEERKMPEGTLNNARLAILADALLDAGCDDEDLIQHCRSKGPHVRGCWAVDLILGKN